MIHKKKSQSWHVVISLVLCLIVTNFSSAGLAGQPDESNSSSQVFMPIVMKPLIFQESIGELDPSFDSDGWVTTNRGDDENAVAIAIQSDGKIVVAGTASDGLYDSNFALVRYNPDGSLDLGFGNDGWVTTDFNNGYELSLDYGRGITIRSDGKIIVVGEASNGRYSVIGMARYNPNGSPDLSFGDGDGKLTTDFGTTFHAYDVAVQTDGKIVVAGHGSVLNPLGDIELVRYNQDGSLDTSFNDDGLVITNICTRSGSFSVAVQPDGKIIVAGVALIGSGYDIILVRYNSNGSLDGEFSNDGWLTTDLGRYYDVAKDIVLQTDGKIVVIGVSQSIDIPPDSDLSLVRYNPDGELDLSFGSDGIVITDFGTDTSGSGISLQPDGKKVAAGSIDSLSTNMDIIIARFMTDGSLDTGFNGDGRVTTDIYGGDDHGNAIALQTDGRIVVAGSAWNGVDYDFLLIRYR